MTEEEERAEREEAERLKSQINSLNNRISRAYAENSELRIELDSLVRNISILASNAKDMDREVFGLMSYVSDKVNQADTSTFELSSLIEELSSSYFTFKNLSTASKNVSHYTDEYYTKFSFFHELRRITLGYVVGLDAHICSDENMRKKVEKVYLQNTDYWLAYGIMAVMLWASNEEEAANRAVTKAMSMDFLNTSLFFLLINLRFTRTEAAKKWYLCYLSRVDKNNLGVEWQYILQAYLKGGFGGDTEFSNQIKEYFKDMLISLESMNPDYKNQVTAKTREYADIYLHITDQEYEHLRRYCKNYDQMKKLLSDAEKNGVLATRYKRLLEGEKKENLELFQRIEDILYSLINAYDQEEFKVIKNLRYNEMIVRAKGDIGLAQQFFNASFGEEQEMTSIDKLLFDWAFTEDERVDISVRKFAISHLKKWICAGFETFAKEYRQEEKAKYTFAVDGWEGEYDEDSYEEAKVSLSKHYYKNRFKDTFSDRYIKVFSGMCLVSLLIILIMFFFFQKIALVIGILLGIIGGFLLWRRIVDMTDILKSRRDKGCRFLNSAMEELRQWRKDYKLADEKAAYLIQVFEEFN